MIEYEEELTLEKEQTISVIKSKRGRKSKKELMESLNLLNVEHHQGLEPKEY